MKKYQILCCFLLLVLESFSLEASVPELRRTECGGSLKADSNSLSYPGVAGESLIPGETCVWTIHLETTRDFRINFTQFDVNASNSSCSNGAVRLYSLSNLVPADRIEEYSLCSENAPGDNFYLGGNIAVLVLHVSPSNSRPGSGFTITWEGNAFDQLGTRHLTTFSSTDRGVISYPGIGTYESSVAATWLISKELDTSSPSTDLELSQLRLESCSRSDPCTCDALLIYEVNSFGQLRESTRYCSNVTSPITTNALPNSFLLAFFSDFLPASNGATGFSVVYYPSDSSETTTDRTDTTTEQWVTTTGRTEGTSTTEQWVTTTDRTQGTSTTERVSTERITTTTERETTTVAYNYCGQTLTAPLDYIAYKPNTVYEPNERCVFVIAPTNATRITVSVTYNPYRPLEDGLLATAINRANASDLVTTKLLTTGTSSFDANMLIITFYSNPLVQQEGFQLFYSVISSASGSPPPSSEVISSSLELPSSTRVRYPPGGGTYGDNSLATFIYTPNFSQTSNTILYGDVTNVSLETECNCCDAIYIYQFSLSAAQWQPHPEYRICGESPTAVNILSKDMLLFVFSADYSLGRNGFNIEFSVSSG